MYNVHDAAISTVVAAVSDIIRGSTLGCVFVMVVVVVHDAAVATVVAAVSGIIRGSNLGCGSPSFSSSMISSAINDNSSVSVPS